VNASVKLPSGYTLDWAGEYENQKRSEKRLLLVLPFTILLIYFILYTMIKSVKWALLITNVAMARIGGLLALLITHTNFSVSSGVGFLALFGVRCKPGSLWWSTSINCAPKVMPWKKPPWKAQYFASGRLS
jgi:cobalt-zinc-cadmium resistance protein CzcA